MLLCIWFLFNMARYFSLSVLFYILYENEIIFQLPPDSASVCFWLKMQKLPPYLGCFVQHHENVHPQPTRIFPTVPWFIRTLYLSVRSELNNSNFGASWPFIQWLISMCLTPAKILQLSGTKAPRPEDCLRQADAL